MLVLFGGLVLVQHLRHGWPFSLHHGMASSRSSPAPQAVHASGAAKAEVRAPVEIESSRLSALGIRVERVRPEIIARPLRTVASVAPDESRLSHVHTRVSGWIEELRINTTGQPVRAGQALAGIFSQELLSSQSEYLAARRASEKGPASAVAEGARSRLKVLGMTDAEVRAIERSGQPRRLVTVSAPRSGVVIHKGITVGTAVDPSTELVVIADLSKVWILAEVPESDIPNVERATPVSLEFPGSGLVPFEAPVDFLYPTLSERTRTLRVRIIADNPTGALRPGLYGTAEFRVRPRSALTISRDAVVDTGASQHVFLVEGEGRFVPKAVKLGARFEDRVEVLEGLHEGDSIVASGVFLIDSESRLRASGGGTGHAHGVPRESPPDTEHSEKLSPTAPPAHTEHSENPTAPSPHSGHSVMP